jgi:hypothetical protein
MINFIILLISCSIATSCIIREPSENEIHIYNIMNELTQEVRVDFYDSNDTIVTNYLSFNLSAFETWDTTIMSGFNFALFDGVDSAVLTFADLKKLTYYPSTDMETKNILFHYTYLEEGYPTRDRNGEYVYSYKFPITEEDYLLAE